MGMSKRLVAKLDLTLDELLRYDFGIGILGGIGGIILAVSYPKTLHSTAPIVIGLVGVVIGAAIAGMAVIAALMDGVFIRKVHAIGRRTSRYVAPFAFTALLGVCAALVLLVLVSLPTHAFEWLRITVGGLAGLFAVWTVASVLPLLSLTMDFVELKGDAANVPDSSVADGNVHQMPDRTGSG